MEVETSYYDQCVAPILNEMSGYVHVESSGGMAQRLYMYCILLLAFSCLLAFYNAQLTCYYALLGTRTAYLCWSASISIFCLSDFSVFRVLGSFYCSLFHSLS